MKTKSTPHAHNGKKKSLMCYLLMLMALLVTYDSFADANTRRKNNCRNKNRKYIIRHVRVNGPGSGCPRTVAEDKSCDREVELRVQNFVDNSCRCFMYFSPGLNTAAEAYAVVGPNREIARYSVNTGCRGFRAGSSKLFVNNNGNLVNNNVNSTINEGSIQGTTEVYDYTNNTYTLNNFNADLYIKGPNLINQYSIVRIEIVKINTDSNGVETDQILAESQAKIINGQFIAPNQGSWFSQSDFTITQNNDEIHASFSFESKTINLNYDITEDMDLEVRMIADGGNLEDGESEVETNPISMMVSNTNNSQATFQLLSDIQRNGILTVRNASGSVLWSQPNISLIQNQTSEYTFTTSNDYPSPFFVVQFISSDGIIVVRKFILQ